MSDRSKLITIRLPEDLILDLKAIAHLQGIPYQTMIREYLNLWMNAKKLHECAISISMKELE